MNIQYEGIHASTSDIFFKFVPLQYCIKGAKMHHKKEVAYGNETENLLST